MQDHDFFTATEHAVTLSGNGDGRGCLYGITTTDAALRVRFLRALCSSSGTFTRPKTSLHTTYPKAWVAHYQSENYFAIDPVLKPENFSQGHLPRNDTLFRDAQPLWDAARNHGLRKGMTQCLMLPNRALGFIGIACKYP